MRLFGYPYNDLVICKDSPDYLILMHNIVLHISIYLFPWLHVLCDLSPINNARKHAISVIFISVFFRNINF